MLVRTLAPRFLLTLLVAVLVASACGGSDTATPVASEPDPPVEATDAPTAEPEPAVEPAAEPEDADESVPTETSDDDEPSDATESSAATTTDAATSQRNFDSVSAEVQAFVNEKDLNGAGLIVVHRDEGVIYHEHFGDFDESRISLIASSSKMISAGVLLKLQEQGVLDIDAPVSDVTAWGAGNPEITPAQLISNSSGLVGLGPDLLYAPYICQWLPTEDLQGCGENVFTTEGDDSNIVAPDTEFRYGGAQWQVAGAVAEAASGKSWATLIDEIYAQPCGLESLGFISLGSVVSGGIGYPTAFGGDPDSIAPTTNPSIEGGAYVTTGDYGELLLMHLRGGFCGDNQVLSQESLDTMHADRIAIAYDGDAASDDTGYGMGWWVDRETGRISDGGAFGTVPWLDLDDGYGVYLVIEDTNAVGRQLAGRIEELIHTTVTGQS